MAVKYVPILRYRDFERGALKSVPLSDKCLPLLEIVQGPANRGKTPKTFEAHYVKELTGFNRPVMVDFPMYVRLSQRTKAAPYKFLNPVNMSYASRVAQFMKVQPVPDLIPVVTYNPNQAFQAGFISGQAASLRPHFSRLAFRLYSNGFQAAMGELVQVLAAGDVVILDIHDEPYVNQTLTPLFQQVQALPNCLKVLARSAINEDVRNVDLVDNQQVTRADNSLLAAYVGHGFDAFGDYAGIKKDSLLDGGGISPGHLFYSWVGNRFIGYRYRLTATTPSDRLAEFKLHIGPSVLGSQYYAGLSAQHKAECPGCVKIQSIVNGPDSGKNQGLWKQIAAEHYLYSMEEGL